MDRLTQLFPRERAAIQRFSDDVRATCDRFPLYYLRYAEHNEWEDPALQVNARDHIASLTRM
ncbi:MAG: hypothetical protein IPO79_17900 [Flavobacteriales bacterium]|nr:hypothetical protein [Flavobacteriales bacterium]